MNLEDPAGEPERAAEQLMPLIYDELRAVAQRYFRRQPAGFTLRPTEIVHEACLHLIQCCDPQWTSTAHFRAIATRKIWQVIVDHLKRRYAQKRGGAALHPPITSDSETDHTAPTTDKGPWRRIPLDRVTVEWRSQQVDLLDLADALDALAAESHRLHDVVMLHWFGGMTHAEVAHQLGVSNSTAEKDFRYALAWLHRRLNEAPRNGD